MRRFILLLLLHYIASTYLYSQENQGLVFDNYNPVTSQFINPANIVDAKPWLDINLLGASAFGSNNYLYYPKTTFYNFSSFEEEPLRNSDITKVNAYVNLLSQGPSASLVIGKRSVSVFSTLRAVGNAFNIPPEIIELQINDEGSNVNPDLYDLKNTRAKDMAWGEIGFTYGEIIKAENTDMITAAVSVKRLFGFQNSSVVINGGTVLVLNQDSAVFNSENLRYSYAEPDQNAGKGWGINLGMKYKKMKSNITRYTPHSTSSHCTSVDYKYTIGVSLIDIGYINYKKEAFYGDIDDYILADTTLTENNIFEELERLQKGNKFITSLPSSISVQADYNINDQLFLNASIIQRLPMKNTFGVEKANMLIVSARYESKYFGIGLPITLINYQKVMLGLALRLGYISIGSDHILPFIFKQDINTGSLYVNIKIPILRSPDCRPSRKSPKRKGSNYQKCATWD